MKKVTKIKGNSHQQLSKKKLRVAAYCRVSTDSDAQLESLEAQKSHYENYISSREDWLFAGLYYDEGVSGTKKEKRPALLQMIADCRAGKIDFIITKSISRFARNTTDCLEMVRKLLELNIPVYFEKENLLQIVLSDNKACSNAILAFGCMEMGAKIFQKGLPVCSME